MKKTSFIAIVVVVLSATSLWAQATPTPTPEVGPPIKQVALVTPRFPSLLPGEQLQMTFTVDGQQETGTTWLSSNPSAATVDANGLVTAVGFGMTTILAQSGKVAAFTSVGVIQGEVPTAKATATVPFVQVPMFMPTASSNKNTR